MTNMEWMVFILSGVVAFTTILLFQVRTLGKLNHERTEHNNRMIERLGQILAIALRNDPDGNEQVAKLFDKP